MRELLVLRHAKSSWSHPELSDHDRPLNKRGLRAAPRMGQLLFERGLVPNQIISSTAVRARRTAEAVAEACDYPGKTVLDERLYHAGPTMILDVLSELPGEVERALVVGHNPGMEDLVEHFAQRPVRFVTAALAQVELHLERWDELDLSTPGGVRELWTPRQFDRGS
jgi:phosphohistidine phosphatase